jgi:hypothetical protein
MADARIKLSDKVRNFLRNVFKGPEVEVKETSRSEGLIEKTGFTIYGYDIDLLSMLQIDYDIEGRFQDYLEMDEFPEISSALDIIADDVTAPDEDGNIVRVTSETPGIKEEVNYLFKRLKIEDEIWEITRALCKFGNEFEEIVYDDKGVIGLIYLPPITMRRIENRRGILVGFVQSFTKDFAILPDQVEQIIAKGDPSQYIQGNKIIFEPWEVVHARYRARDRRSIYGYSVVEPARWIWKRLLILEDAVLIYRLTRAADRWIIYVNVGDLPLPQAEVYVRKVMSSMKRKKVIDPSSGKLTERFNPLCVAGDTKVPLLDGRVLTIVELVKEYEEGKENWVYSVDPQTLEIKAGKIVWAGKTRLNAQLVEVGLDNGKVLRVTPDHKFMLRTGEYVEAQHLKSGDSLMPLKRLIATKKKGWSLDNYEVVYNPADGRYVYTHRLVARQLKGFSEMDFVKKVIHHKDLNKLNNHPDNLEILDVEEHIALHKKIGSNGGKSLAEKRKIDKDLDQRLKEGARKNLIKYNKSEEKRKRTSVLNRLYETKKYIIAYNHSEKHLKDNIIRKKVMKELWSNPQKRQRWCEQMRLRFPSEFLEIIKNLVRQYPSIKCEEVVRIINANENYLDVLRKANTRKIKKVHRYLLLKALRRNGYDNFKNLKEKIVSNHKVVYVKFLEQREDTYCITVEPWGNFGTEAGVIIKNSLDEDIFIPVRGDKESVRIETLGGMGYVATEDLEYFRNKLFSALKVPKAYLGYEEAISGRGTLSAEDLRFARTIMRVQNIMSAFLKRIADVHLAIKGINPIDVEYDIFFNLPSTAFEMAKIEIENARIELANAFSDWVSRRWIYSKIFGFSDQEIETILKQKAEEEGGGTEEAYSPETNIPQQYLLGHKEINPKNKRKGNVEKYLNDGNRDLEKKLEDNFEKMMKTNQKLLTKLMETNEFMRELRNSLQKILLERKR